jgi:hypothetical protein
MAPVSPVDNKDRKAQHYVGSFADESTRRVGADESPSLRAWRAVREVVLWLAEDLV